MKYMVMECHPGYAVVLDEGGRFIKVANRHYEIGQTVTEVFEMISPQTEKRKTKILSVKWLSSIAAVAACLMLIVTAVLRFGAAPYGSVYMTINPEVRIDVNKKDIVVGLEGINTDGQDLVQNYAYKNKDLEVVMDELVDLAIEMGYLHEGGQITLTLDAKNNEWVISKGDSLGTHLSEHLTEKLSVTIDVTTSEDKPNVVIPIAPDAGTSADNYGESDYGDVTTAPETAGPQSTGGDSGYGAQTNYDDTDYGPNSDGVTDYGDTDYGPNSDGVTDYTDTDYGAGSDGVTDYETESAVTDTDDGNSGYDDGSSNYQSGDSGYESDSAYGDN